MNEFPDYTVTTRGAGPLRRWSAAAIAIFYGFAKLNGAQFTVLESELDRPLREVSGFWLTWYYFGYSWVYGNLIALAQIIAGLCLTQERLALAGAVLLLPIAANIVLVDIFYGVDPGGLMAAAVLLVLVVSIIWPCRMDLIRVVLGPGRPMPDRLTAVFPALVLCLVAFSVTYWIAHHNNRALTAIDGVWEVEPGTTPHEIERVYFERNRAPRRVPRYVGQLQTAPFRTCRGRSGQGLARMAGQSRSIAAADAAGCRTGLTLDARQHPACDTDLLFNLGYAPSTIQPIRGIHAYSGTTPPRIAGILPPT